MAKFAQGRVACEVNTGDELLCTEIIFSGILADLSPAEAVALLSALVFQVRSNAVSLPRAAPPRRSFRRAAGFASSNGPRVAPCYIFPPLSTKL
jgi:superfamily II RNA helicase